MKQSELAQLWLLPYQQQHVSAAAIRHHLAAKQQHRFDSLSGRRQIEFGITRYFLHYCLQQCFIQASDEIDITEQPHAPPVVQISQCLNVLFSISHSKNLIAILIASPSPNKNPARWGVDIEQCRPINHLNSVELFCNATQAATVLASKPMAQRRHYYTFWTQKEAVLKAYQSGIHHPELKKITAIPSNENGNLWTGYYANQLDKHDYCISAFCQQAILDIQCQQVTIDQHLQLTTARTSNVNWQPYHTDHTRLAIKR